MDVIPVIDVRHGLAVAAVRGQRADYRPLVTPLATGSHPADIARGYAALFTFPVLYVADLDGIEGRGRNVGLTAELAGGVAGTRLWIDDGTPAREAARRIARRTRTRRSSSAPRPSAEKTMSSALRLLPPDRYVLSLDFKGDRFDGPAAVLDEAQHWPHAVIVMTLARVGSGEGPDLARIAAIVAPRRQPPRLCGRRRSQPRRYRGAACGRRGRRAYRHRAACRNDKGRRPQRDRRPLIS